MIIAFPHKPGHGGPGSFQQRFEKQLILRGHRVCYFGDKVKPDLIFVIGGTKRIFWLIQCKLKKIPIYYRLDGITWLHKVKGAQQRNVKNIIRSEFINRLNLFIHNLLADHIIYQSDFVKSWWARYSLKVKVSHSVIRNGVDLLEFKANSSNLDIKVICLEGYLDYSPFAIYVINKLNESLVKEGIEFEVYGDIYSPKEKMRLDPSVNYKGVVSKEDLPKIYSNSIYVSLDINAACPNTVVEAMACGAPVVGYDTGSLSELLGKDTGKVVFYGANIWQVLKRPSVDLLLDEIIHIKENYAEYSKTARHFSEKKYDIEDMMDKYLDIIENSRF